MSADPASPLPQRPIARRQRGLSLVEIMVGLTIALLVSLAAASSARMFSASQRQGMAVGGMGTNGGTALAAIKNDAASAGLGFFMDSNFVCHRLSLSFGNGTPAFDNALFAPARITRNGNNDELEVMYANVVDAGANLFLAADTAGATASVRSLLPVAVGQAVLLSPGTPGTACMVRTATATAAATEFTPQLLTFANTGLHNQATFATPLSFVADNSRVTLLGALTWNRYRLVGTELRIDRRTDGTSATLVRNVMAFRVQYGITDAGGSTLTGWQDATGATWSAISGATVDRVRALRIGIVTRSPQPEKRNAAGDCEASAARPRDPLDPSVEVTPDVTDWACYRFRSSVVVVPLRNFSW